jgi:hypothetical protein
VVATFRLLFGVLQRRSSSVQEQRKAIAGRRGVDAAPRAESAGVQPCPIAAHIRFGALRPPGDKSAERLRQMDALRSTPKQVEDKLTAEINQGRDRTAPGLFRQRVVIQRAEAFGDNIKAETGTKKIGDRTAGFKAE